MVAKGRPKKATCKSNDIFFGICDAKAYSLWHWCLLVFSRMQKQLHVLNLLLTQCPLGRQTCWHRNRWEGSCCTGSIECLSGQEFSRDWIFGSVLCSSTWLDFPTKIWQQSVLVAGFCTVYCFRLAIGFSAGWGYNLFQISEWFGFRVGPEDWSLAIFVQLWLQQERGWRHYWSICRNSIWSVLLDFTHQCRFVHCLSNVYCSDLLCCINVFQQIIQEKLVCRYENCVGRFGPSHMFHCLSFA